MPALKYPSAPQTSYPVKYDFRPDSPEDDDACLAATGKTYDQWFAAIEAAGLSSKRREGIQMIYDATGRGKDVWWPTTVAVNHKRIATRAEADGLRRAWAEALERLKAKLG